MTDYTRSTVRQAIVSTLIAANTDAGVNVFSSRTEPVQVGQMPLLLVYTTRETKQSLALSGSEPQFRVTLTVDILARVEGIGTTVEQQLDDLVDQSMNALLYNIDFVKMFDHIGDIHTAFDYKDQEALPYGQAHMSIDLVWDEVYQPVIPNNFDEMYMNVKLPTGAPIVIDIIMPTEYDETVELDGDVSIIGNQG